MATATATATAAAAAAVAPLPSWVMLERFVFRRDDLKSFRGDPRTSASCTTCNGDRFDVSFVLAEPPTPSRIYVSWPAGPDVEMVCQLLAAHGDLVLLGLDSLIDPSNRFGEWRSEYFVYIAAPPATSQQQVSAPPLLRALPLCMEYIPVLEKSLSRQLTLLSTGLLCHGEDEFVVASLDVHHSHQEPELKAELWVLHSCRYGGGGAKNWERKLLPIRYKEDDEEERHNLLFWVADEVVPFKDSLCFVNYRTGILVCDGILGDSPRVSYTRFPVDSFAGHDRPGATNKELYRSLCVTDGGSRLAFVGLTRHDDTAKLGLPAAAYTFTVQTVDMVENGTVLWQSIDEALKVVIPSAQLLDYGRMFYPLLSMDVASVVHLVLVDSEVFRVSLVAIDLVDGKVLGSVVPYIKSWTEGLSADDDDLVKEKPIFFVRFLPSEFPKFLNLNRSIEEPTSHVQDSRKCKVEA